MHLKILTPLLFTLLFYSHSFAQIGNNYTPIVKENINKSELKKNLEKKMITTKELMQSKYKKEGEEVYQNMYNTTITGIDSGAFYFDDTIYAYFQNILKNIQAANAELKNQDIKLLVSRSSYPNAYCNAAGILVFNIGLLRYLSSESQAAFVICHEIAHFTQNHIMADFVQNLNKLYSKETQSELKKIKFSSIGVYTKTIALLKNYVTDSRKHSRAHESEADSVAYFYMQKTGYDEREGLSLMAVLDSVDEEKYRDSISLSSFFDFKDFPFKKSWIAEEKQFIFSEDTIPQSEKDSLKTHPNCKKRMEDLSRLSKNISVLNKKDFIQSKELFNKLVLYSDFECIANKLKAENLDGAFYLSLKLLKKYPHNIYLHQSVNKCFDMAISGLTNHNLNHYLDLPSPFQEKDYKIIIRFLNNLRISEIQEIKKQFNLRFTSN